VSGNGKVEQSRACKGVVQSFWNEIPCGSRGISPEDRRAFFRDLELERYELEPYLKPFASFEKGRGRRVLEVGVGAGTDFINWVRNGADATGIDLTEAGVRLARERLDLEGRSARLCQGDAENLPFRSGHFDLVYSYGVVHHSPDTARAIGEIHRVLRPGGTARVMIYHHPSLVGLMLWSVHCAGKLKPWKSPRWAVFQYLESPGTKAYSIGEARELFGAFGEVSIRTQLSHGDLLQMRPGPRYQRGLYRTLWRLYPRSVLKLVGNRLGTGLLVEATK
jgi:SAM-dependent methyltransferase